MPSVLYADRIYAARDDLDIAGMSAMMDALEPVLSGARTAEDIATQTGVLAAPSSPMPTGATNGDRLDVVFQSSSPTPPPASLGSTRTSPPFGGVAEIACGVRILAGLLTRLEAVPMVIDMLGALLITKMPNLWGHAPLFRTERGWWDFIHESRIDLAQLCGSLFLLIVGAGVFFLDATRSPRGLVSAALARDPPIR